MNRPVIYEHTNIQDYLKAMQNWARKNIIAFSIRMRCKDLRRCSPTLVSQVIRGARVLTPERVEDFSKIFELTTTEKAFLKQWSEGSHEKKPQNSFTVPSPLTRKGTRRTETVASTDYLLKDPLNVYVKDACRIKGFKDDTKTIARILGGMATEKRIARSLKYLLEQGYLCRTLDGKIVENEELTTTSDNVPSQKVRNFHKHALETAKRAIDTYPLETRRASAIVLPLNADSREKLKKILQSFYENILEFAEHHVDDSDQLYQVLINLSPVGAKLSEEK